jgi:hypothetical protein
MHFVVEIRKKELRELRGIFLGGDDKYFYEERDRGRDRQRERERERQVDR